MAPIDKPKLKNDSLNGKYKNNVNYGRHTHSTYDRLWLLFILRVNNWKENNKYTLAVDLFISVSEILITQRNLAQNYYY